MKRNNAEITIEGNTITMAGIKDFDPDQIFDCGQCFRWEKGKSWQGIAGGRVARVQYDLDSLTLTVEDSLAGKEGERAVDFWWNYFDLDRDYSAVKEFLCRDDEVMKKAAGYGGGIRILNQEPWETLLSFIISQNNNIPRIKKCINSLAEALGKPVGAEINGRQAFALPGPEVLAGASEEDLAECRLGYRAGYLIKAAGEYLEQGMGETASELQKFTGVGPKVANCVALFCLGKADSFPIDVWMRRVMNRLYGIPENNLKAMTEYADRHFAPYGGIAQQYLFYYITHESEENY